MLRRRLPPIFSYIMASLDRFRIEKASLIRKILFISFAFLMVALITWAGYLRFVKGYGWAEWTEFGEYTAPDGTYYRAKTLWDLLELFIVSLVLALIAFMFNWSMRNRERETTQERLYEANLQAYLDKMAELVLEKDLQWRSIFSLSSVRNVAQVRTTTTLRTLDKDRRDIVFQFLRDSGLATSLLAEAHLGEIDLRGTNVYGINLSGAALYDANLSEANFNGAHLSDADLSGVNLRKALLIYADLSGVNLERADLRGANLESSNLQGAALDEAKLHGANLRGADLTGAKVNISQLKKARSIESATLPDGNRNDLSIQS